MRQKGFTLVELLVAIGIIGILSSIAVVSVSNVRAKARDAKRIGDIKQIQSAMESYFNDQNQYPDAPAGGVLGTKDATDGLCVSTADPAKVGFQKGTDCAGGTIYINPVPKGPTPGVAGKTDYAYSVVNGEYVIKFSLESGSGTLVKGSYKATPNGIITE